MLAWIPLAVTTWSTIGVLVAVPFLLAGVGRVVAGSTGSSVAFRLLILPGTVVLWPLILRRWIAARRGTPPA